MAGRRCLAPGAKVRFRSELESLKRRQGAAGGDAEDRARVISSAERGGPVKVVAALRQSGLNGESVRKKHGARQD